MTLPWWLPERAVEMTTLIQDAPVRISRRAPAEALPVASERGSNTRTIGVWGPSGSPGKSTIAIGIADSLARAGKKVLLVDVDIHNPSLALMLGVIEKSQSLSTVLDAMRLNASPSLWVDLVVSVRTSRGSFDLVAGISSPDRWSEVRFDDLRALSPIQNLYDFVVFDMATPVSDVENSRRNGLTLDLLKSVDDLFVLGRPDLVGVQRLAESLLELRRIRRASQIHLVFNQTSTHGSVGTALDAFELLARERINAVIARDRRVFSTALAQGTTISRVRRSGKVQAQFDSLLEQVLTPRL
jgi:MinD-like ATPase involved in chromosome partitioning or flagellar assembly